MKTRPYIVLAMLMCTSLLCQNAVVGDDEFAKLASKWTAQRDTLVLNIVRSWLRGATAQSLKPEIVELVSIESRLAVQGDVPLYMTYFSDTKDPEKTLSDLVRAYLRRRGIEFQTRDFLVGKEFKVMKEEVRPVDPSVPPSGNKFKFQLWGKSTAGKANTPK